MSEPNLEIRPYRPGDETALLECYHRVFGADTPEGRMRTMERWRWQWEQNPVAGATDLILLAVDRAAEKTRVAGHFACMPVRMFDRGVSKNAGLAVDLMVDPVYRRGLRRPGLFGNLGVEWFTTYQKAGMHDLVFGFPNQLSYRIGNAVLCYEVVRTQPVLYREPLSTLSRGRGIEVQEVSEADESFDALFERLAPDLKLLVWRDAKYINWRYATHPDFKYRIFAARDANGLRGWAVVRVCDWFVPSNCVLVDWLVPGGDIDATRELLVAAGAVRADSGSPCTSILLPDNNPWYRDLQLEGFMVIPTEYICCVVSLGKPYSTYVLRREWYYTHGDFDHI